MPLRGARMKRKAAPVRAAADAAEAVLPIRDFSGRDERPRSSHKKSGTTGDGRPYQSGFQRNENAPSLRARFSLLNGSCAITPAQRARIYFDSVGMPLP